MGKLVVGNLKMNLLSSDEREKYFELFKKEISGKRLGDCEIVLCPPFIHLEVFKKTLSKRTKIGAQNMFWEGSGSYTGEISGAMLKNFGCDYVIIGHSERRKYFCENNEEVNLKVQSAVKADLKPIICIGETRIEKETQQMLSVITKQLKKALEGVTRPKLENIVVAYEPVWAVGTDITPTAHEIMEAKVLIRKILVEGFGKKYAEKVPILYGGSVNSRTVKNLCNDPEMDGILVGRESLVPHEFIKIAEIISNSN
ncbi:MAG TPA: triose-phosphate isomerase [Candidatus Moranbacteria bacterium]|nr:triose-phosphate isomerase [Candidatus Moranbacteria bacterium]